VRERGYSWKKNLEFNKLVWALV
jgi:hypothetical protein